MDDLFNAPLQYIQTNSLALSLHSLKEIRIMNLPITIAQR